MSTPRHCGIWKASSEKWYMDLADHGEPDEEEDYYGPLGSYEDSTTYGPFDTFETAYDYLDNFSNPGSFYTDESGKKPYPKISPNGRPVVSPRKGRFYENNIREVLSQRFGLPLVTSEGFGTRVDNSWNRIGIEDERDEADTDVHDDLQWSQFKKNKKIVAVR